MPLPELPAASDILASLDLAAVENAILHDPDGNTALLGFEYSEAKEMVVAAAEKWLRADLELLSAPSMGLEKSFEIRCGGYPVKGFIDLMGQYRGGEKKGQVLVADWKTSEGELDKTWESRLVASKQWRTYAVATGANYISYRGISRKLKTREVYIVVPPIKPLTLAVNTHYCMIGDQMRALEKYDTWPQHNPSACGMFGQTCVFKAECDFNAAPRYQLVIDDIVLSYSGAERFQSCPEKYRRMKQAEKGLDGTEATRLGRAVHAGLETLYALAFDKYGQP